MTSASVLEAGPRVQAPAAGVRLGDVLNGRYRLEEFVGRGGMGAVFRASDLVLERTVAIKMFSDTSADGQEVARRASETRLLASLSHPSLVTLFDSCTTDDGISYLVLEYVDGGTLSDRIARGPIPPAEVAEVAAELAEALHAVHGAGVIHRDIKPANVLLHSAPSVVRASLADFGIAYLVDGARLTTPGMAVGTAAYFSPEQARGAQPSPASDIYALGLVLIEALTGRRAFPQTTPIEAAVARLHTVPDVPTGFGYGWRSLLTAMTATDPAARPTALEAAERARALLADDEAGATAAAAAVAPDATAAVALNAPEQDPQAPATRAVPLFAAPEETPAEVTHVMPVPEIRRRERRRTARRRSSAGLVALGSVAALALGFGAWGASASLLTEPAPTGARQIEVRVAEPRVAPSAAPQAEAPAPVEPVVAEPVAPADTAPAEQAPVVEPAAEVPSEKGKAPEAPPAASEDKTRGNGNGNGNGEPGVGTPGSGRGGD